MLKYTLVLLTLLTQLSTGELFYMGLKNYSMTKKENLPIAVFYFGQDRNSRKFYDEFISLAEKTHELVNRSSLPAELNFGVVNTQVENVLKEKTQITDIPTLYLFLSDDQKQKYTGGWNAQNFVNWVKKTFRENPELNQYHPSSLITKFDQLQTKFSMFNLVAVLVTPDYRLAPLKAFVAAAKQLPDGFVFCHVHDPKLAQSIKVDKEESKLMVYSKQEDIESTTSDEDRKKWGTYIYNFEGDVRSTEDIYGFLSLYSWRGFYFVDDSKLQKLQRRNDMLPTIILLYNRTIVAHQDYVKVVQASRYSLVKKAAVGLLDTNNDAKERVERYWAINATNDIPRLVAIKPKNDKEFFKYIDLVDNTLDPLDFYNKMNNNEIVPFYKNQGVLAPDQLYDKAGVRKLTRETYDSYIKQSNKESKDVLVMYSALKCEPCQGFKVEYHSLFKKIKNLVQDKLIFTRVDIELNELDGVFIDVYPHIKLYKAGFEDGPFTHHGEKSEQGLLKWLQETSNYGHLLSDIKVDL